MPEAFAVVSMSDGVPRERFEADGRVTLLRVRTYVVAAVLATAGYLLVRAVAGRATAVAVASGAVVVVLFLTYTRADGTTYAMYPDRLVAERGGPFGGQQAVAWTDVAFATRRQSRRAARFGVATFELVRAGGPDLHVRYVTETERFADALVEHVPPPEAWLADRTQDRLALYVAVEALADRADTVGRHDGPGGSRTESGLVVTEAELADVLGVDRGDLVVDELGHITGVGTVGDLDSGRFSGAHERLFSDSLGLSGTDMDADRTGSFDGMEGPSLNGTGHDGTGGDGAGSLGEGGGGAEGGGE